MTVTLNSWRQQSLTFKIFIKDDEKTSEKFIIVIRFLESISMALNLNVNLIMSLFSEK